MANKIVVLMEDEDHVTTRTRRFREVVPDDEEPVIGTVYLPKRTLKNLGVEQVKGTRIEVEVRPA
jgi:hypothetical protein